MKSLMCVILAAIVLNFAPAPAQQKHDTGKMIDYKNEYWEKIKSSVKEYEKKKEKPHMKFKMDFSGYDLPKSIDEFTVNWANPPISQGNSGMCWCFSTTSYFETEEYRLYKKHMKFSELFTVYWEYVEKARRYIREKGDSKFDQGSEANAVKRIWKQYGCVPEDDYTGLQPGQEFHSHDKMYHEMMSYLESVKESNAWNEDVALSTIKSIMNSYIGAPPTEVKYEGKTYTPKEFMQNVVKLNMDDYVDIMSLKMSPYWKHVEYKVPDNWKHDSTYINVPLDVFMSNLKNAVKNGYTLFIGGDVSESGYDSHSEVAMVPSYDIPSDYIDENARQFRFSNGSTTDDHGIHLIGYKESPNGWWFLIKDSGSGSRNGNNKGYYFYHEDYIKLKIMDYLVHKSAVPDIMAKVKD